MDHIIVMNTQSLYKPVINLSFFFKIYLSSLHYFDSFYLHLNSGELESLTVSQSGKKHKSIYISDLHAAQVIYSPITHLYYTKLHCATTRKAIQLKGT
jgi:hypothetical protein